MPSKRLSGLPPRSFRRSEHRNARATALLRHKALVHVVLELGVRDGEGSGLAGALIAFSAIPEASSAPTSAPPTSNRAEGTQDDKQIFSGPPPLGATNTPSANDSATGHRCATTNPVPRRHRAKTTDPRSKGPPHVQVTRHPLLARRPLRHRRTLPQPRLAALHPDVPYDQKGPAPLQAGAPTWLEADNGFSEDCLNLNVWAPEHAADEPLPVIVYIYGGGFEMGANTQTTSRVASPFRNVPGRREPPLTSGQR